MKRHALTLTELLITIGILGIVGLIVLQIFISTGQFYSDEQLRIDVGENADRLLGNLDAILRQGKTILPSASYQSVVYTTNETNVVFNIPTLMSDQTLSLVNNDTIILHLDSSEPTNLNIKQIIIPYTNLSQPELSSIRPAGEKVVTSGIKDIYFRYTSDDPTLSRTITVTATAAKTVRGRTFSQAVVSYITLRNAPT